MSEELKSKISLEKLPSHLAVIMDGNGRWAQQFNEQRVFGHQNGVNSVREVTEAAAELGIRFLTLYAFSTENWARPEDEVNALMELLVETLSKEVTTLNKNNIELRAIGDLSRLPEETYKALGEAIQSTKNNERMVLTLALNYSSRWEIVKATQDIAFQVQSGDLQPEEITDELFSDFLVTRSMPDPEFLIRTSGEQRISNFLLYQLAYTELYFTDVFWPDFDKNELYKALIDYQSRERRFGKTSDQIR